MANQTLSRDALGLAELYAVKLSVTALLSLWCGSQKNPDDAYVAFEATVHSAISSLKLGPTFPEQMSEPFRAALRESLATIVQSARQSFQTPEGPTRAQ